MLQHLLIIMFTIPAIVPFVFIMFNRRNILNMKDPYHLTACVYMASALVCYCIAILLALIGD